MKEILKLNEEESSNLNLDYDSCKAIKQYSNSSTLLEFEENDMLDELHLEIMGMHCQDAFAVGCKREELKMKLNLIDENDDNVLDYEHLKKMRNAAMIHGKENVTSYPSEKVLRKESIEWCNYERYYERKHSLLNLTKLKLVANKKGMQFEKSVLKKDLLTKMPNALTVRATLSNNNTGLQKHFAEKMITCVFKSSFLKRRVTSSQESKHCKLGHRLE